MTSPLAEALRRPVSAAAAALLVLLVAACEVTPVLTFDPGSEALAIGQRASIVVEEGGDGSGLVASSFTLTDAAKRTYDAKSAELQLKSPSERELWFSVPPGAAAGKAALRVSTFKGPAISGEVAIQRLVAIRDLGGKIWLPALQGGGEAKEDKALAAGRMGFGRGRVAIGDKGRLMASFAASTGHFHLAWLGRTPQASSPHLFGSSTTLNDLAVTAGGVTLIGTSDGTYLVQRPTTALAAPSVTTPPLATGDTIALAADRAGTRAVALARGKPGTPKAGRFYLTLIDLYPSVPALLHQLEVPWSASSAARPVVTVSDGAKHVVVVDGAAGKLALFVDGKAPGKEVDLPGGQTGAVAVAASKAGDEIYIANSKSLNLSVGSISGGSVSFGAPTSLSFGSQSPSGAPVDVAVTPDGDVLILMQHDLVLLYDNRTKAKQLTFDKLFQDKISGEEGGALAVQP